MSLVLSSEPLPLETNADGVVRIAGSRVTLDTVVAAFRDGLSAEEIAQQYSTLPLGQVYAVIGYYLAHQQDVDAYLRDRSDQASGIRQENERRFPPDGVRARLLARRNTKE